MNLQFSEEKLNSIKEFVFVTGTVPELDFLALNFTKKHLHLWMERPYSNIVYLDLPAGIEIISIKQAYKQESIKPEYNFRDQLLHLKELSHETLTYLCSLYNETNYYNSRLFDIYDGAINYFKAFTKHTNGYIAYMKQAACIYMLLSDLTYDEAVNEISLLMIKNEEAIEKAKNLSIDGTTSFYDAWEELTIEGCIYKYKKKPVPYLYQHLIS